MDHPLSSEKADVARLRACVLQELYGFFREFPYGAMEPAQLEANCRADAKSLNWNLVYLEKCGYVELGRGGEAWPYVACTAAITAAGIDLVEDDRRFRARFGDASHGRG